MVFGLMLMCHSCKNPSSTADYDESLDDLVKGVYFGMTKDDFFKHCWDMNQVGETNHGTIGNMVMYKDSINFDPKVVINFYPEFVDDKISELPMIFYFHAWAPWNKAELPQEKLEQQVKTFFEKRYNMTMEKKDAGNGKHVYFKVVGPLMIRVYKDSDDMLIKADIRNSVYMKSDKQ